ncbi:hypothetical protein BKA70DRAFT_825592 [Coprinopsis sp. MPI-PUGE-AT-0042]|nr:hypothetical protein BKA70DRAFT_825592 [Coprinopsis sp. MPI-PUGE-AT-0042]
MEAAVLFCLLGVAHGYWLMGANNVLTTQRIDPITNPDDIGLHVHGVLGSSNFGFNLSTSRLRQSECTSMPVKEDKSNYWYPQLYFWSVCLQVRRFSPLTCPRWNNGSFTSVEGNPVICKAPTFPTPLSTHQRALDYLYSDKPGETTAFPDDFRMLSGDPTLRAFNESDFSQRAITFLCLDFNGESKRTNELPHARCPQGIRAEVNFPSCWDGTDIDSPNHRSHMAFLSSGPDSGTCEDPAYPVTVPRIFLEVYWYTQAFDELRGQARSPDQPFVFATGDPTGYGFHGDFFNGWDEGALQKAIDECNCNPFGDPKCCAEKGVFTFDQSDKCFITDAVGEQTLGLLLDRLPGPNPIQKDCYENFQDTQIPSILSPVYVHNGTNLGPSDTVTSRTPSQTFDVVQKAKGTCIANSALPTGHEIFFSAFSIVVAVTTWTLVL